MSYSVDIGLAGDERLRELLKPSLVDPDAMDARVSDTFAGEPDAIAQLILFLLAEGQPQGG